MKLRVKKQPASAPTATLIRLDIPATSVGVLISALNEYVRSTLPSLQRHLPPPAAAQVEAIQAQAVLLRHQLQADLAASQAKAPK